MRARFWGRSASNTSIPRWKQAKDADALLVLTDWDEFRSLDLAALRKALHYPIVIDGRNLFSPEAMAEHGFIYTSVGRPDVSPELPHTSNSNGRRKASVTELRPLMQSRCPNLRLA